MNDVVEKIKEKLTQIEKTHNVHILYACESGSRAWGFASADSDYDVRFVFIRPLEEYLKINEQADYIDSELNEIFDINGWDLKKFFKNIYKSNPVLFEWINSPIVYRTSSEWDKIKSVVFDYAQEKALIFHYKGMLRKNCMEVISKTQKENFSKRPDCKELAYALCNSQEEISYKKYLYILRPLLACEWIIKKHSVPPTEFWKLVKEVVPKDLQRVIENLVNLKKNAREKEKAERFSQIDLYIESRMKEIDEYNDICENIIEWDKLNLKFLETLKSVW